MANSSFLSGYDAIFLPGKIHGCEDQAYIIYYNESGGDSVKAASKLKSWIKAVCLPFSKR